jgi:predicted amidohydrolase YtcJ
VRRLVIDLYPAEPAERVVDGQTLMTVAWIVAQAYQYARDHPRTKLRMVGGHGPSHTDWPERRSTLLSSAFAHPQRAPLVLRGRDR